MAHQSAVNGTESHITALAYRVSVGPNGKGLKEAGVTRCMGGKEQTPRGTEARASLHVWGASKAVHSPSFRPREIPVFRAEV